MPKHYVKEFEYNDPVILEWARRFKIPPNKFKPKPKVRIKRMVKKIKSKQVVILSDKQLKKYKAAKTPEGKMQAVGMKGGTRAVIDIKKKLIKRLTQTSHLVETSRSFSKFSERRKLTEALADHLAGETIHDAALKYCITPGKLANFKNKFLKADSAIPQYVEELFMQAAVECVGIFQEKKADLTAMQAVIAAGIFAERSTQLKKARSQNYQEDVIPLNALQKLADVMDRIGAQKKLAGRDVIELSAEDIRIKQLADKSND